MSAPDPNRPQIGSQQENQMNTLEPAKITVFGYTMEQNLYAAICYLPIPPANIIPCVIALNTPCENPEFIRFNAVQSLIVSGGFFAATTILGAVMGIIGMIPFLGGMINMVLGLGQFVLIIAYVLVSLKLVTSAFTGKTFRVPMIADYAEKYSSR